MTRTILIGLLALAACADDPDGGDGGATGEASLRFAVTNGVRANPTLTDPLVGAIYGNVFLAQDVKLTGPVDGAMQYADVEMLGVDLTAAAATTGPWSTGPLAPGTYVFLGFYDVDGNGATSKEPDPGDPVTLPVTNQFEIVAGQTTTVDAVFDLVLN